MLRNVGKSAALVLSGLLVLSLSACGTILGGSAQEINVGSTPTEATVKFDRVNRTVTTPAEVELERKDSYELTFTKEGYTTETAVVESDLRAGILVLDILFTGVLGVAIDAGTGAWNALSPENVNVSLQQKSASAAGPDRIHVRLGTSNAGEAATLSVQSDAPVEVRIEPIE